MTTACSSIADADTSLRELLSRAVLEMRSDAIVVADRSGIIQFWNAGAVRIFGHTKEEAVGKSLDLIIPERLRQRHSDGFRKAMLCGYSRYANGEVLSAPAIRKDGQTISVQFTIVELRDDTQIIAMAALMRDVTAQFEEIRELKHTIAELKRGRSS